MSWRNLVITNPTRLNFQNGQLLCHRENEELLSVPMEDIATITLETPQALITSALLGACAEMGIGLITCNAYHMPNGVLLPLTAHSRPLLSLKKQIKWTTPFKKRAWQNIICQKIENQRQVLAYRGKESSKLAGLTKRVLSGDPENREAQAARYYFSQLFFSFKRHANDKPNAALNYGYAVVRAAIARELTKFGFHPAIGIHHHNELNAFNLADDLLEPFRPLIDIWTLTSIDFSATGSLSIKERATLTQVLQLACHVEKKEQRLLHAIHLVVKSLSSATIKNDYNCLSLPTWESPAQIKSIA